MFAPAPPHTLFPYTTLFRSEADPTRAAYHRNLANSKRFEPDDPQLAVMEALTRDPRAVPEHERIDLQFALGKAFADLKQHRSEEHTSELQSHSDLVCRLLLE